MSRHVQVELFARLRELAGSSELSVPLSQSATVGDLRDAIGRIWQGEGRNLAQRSAVAVNGEYARDDLILGDGDEIALIPPVSGG
jgi:molybdopterin converting factor subunit 1